MIVTLHNVLFVQYVRLPSNQTCYTTYQEDCNVICVDWAAGAVDPNYVRAAVNTRLVGKQVTLDTDKFKPLAVLNHQVALLIKAINLEFGDINNNTHLVGFSLGAHVSGFVGKELRNLSRITGGLIFKGKK